MKNRGITLIALIITIIILLILAGITFSALFGDNGIILQAKNASDNTKKVSVIEDIELAWNARMSAYYEALAKDSSVSILDFFSREDLEKELKYGTVSYYTIVNGEITFLYTMNSTEKQYEILINSSGKVSVTLSSEEVIASSGDDLYSTPDNENETEIDDSGTSSSRDKYETEMDYYDENELPLMNVDTDYNRGTNSSDAIELPMDYD
jgi:type II secretory pathway pseudopilin PulG